jgi:hypothetical protein
MNNPSIDKAFQMKDILGPLLGPVQSFSQYKSELKDLEPRARQAQSELDRVVNGHTLSETEANRIISESNESLALVKMRAPYLRKRGEWLLGELKAAVRETDLRWTSIVRASGDKLATSFYHFNSQFYENERECRRNMNHESLPAWNEINRALWHGTPSDLTEGNALVMIGQFVAKVESNLSKFDLSV